MIHLRSERDLGGGITGETITPVHAPQSQCIRGKQRPPSSTKLEVSDTELGAYTKLSAPSYGLPIVT
jgi:hypothetical protein